MSESARLLPGSVQRYPVGLALRLGKLGHALGRLSACGGFWGWMAAKFLGMQTAISLVADTSFGGTSELPTRRITSGSKRRFFQSDYLDEKPVVPHAKKDSRSGAKPGRANLQELQKIAAVQRV
ncbi:MAG: hypothetical protein VYA84_02355 [Planctomycetota bacterium]|nr:hypothetical protein [Planctomycetota bacterium]